MKNITAVFEENKYYFTFVDEPTGFVVKKQMALVKRIFDKDDIGKRLHLFLNVGMVQEVTVRYMNGSYIYILIYDQVIHEHLESVGLDIIDWYGQG